MKPNDQVLRFLLGANTPQGFVSRFEGVASVEDGWRLLIIKGGPGSGKSTMMKRIAAALEPECDRIEYIHCSSDIDSLDGLVVPSLRFAIVDGTPPHAIEPKYPGAFESIVDITSCWEAGKLQGARERIVELAGRCTRCHEHCCRFLAAAAALCTDTYHLALECVNKPKLAGYCSRLADRELKPAGQAPGRESVRFLSAVTNKGLTKFTDTARQLCERVYLVNDDYGAVSRLLLQSMRSQALAAGYDIISCYCPLSPYEKLEHLFIPSLRLGFVTSNHFHDFSEEVDPYRIVNCQRFSDKEQLSGYKKRILFNRKAASQMLLHAETLLRDAKLLHDELEGYYIHATDFARVDALTESVIADVTR